MSTFNPFANDAFSLVSMTAAINVYPNQYGKIQALGLFQDVPIRFRTALIERRNGVLTLLPSVPVGAPPTVGVSAKRDVISVPIPHIPHSDVVLPDEVQGIRQFGTESSAETIMNVMATKLSDMSRKHDITLEYLRMGAIKGLVIDGDGATTLLNLFTAFGVTQQVQGLALPTSTTEVAVKVQNITRYLEDNLKGETMAGVTAFCSGSFYDALTTHPTVKTAYQYYVSQQNVMREDQRSDGFIFQGVKFVEYRGVASDAGGTARKFIPDDEAYAFPTGTQKMFQTYFAPANLNETVNTLGMPKYAKQEEKRMGQGWDIWTESNPLPICLRPDLLVKLTKT